MKRYDLIVVGAGPSGLSAAIEAAKRGLKVVVFDENEKPGGQLFKQIHKFFGSKEHKAKIRGFVIGEELLTEAAKAGLAASKTAWMRYGVMLSIKTNYTDLGRIQFLLAGKGLEAECIYTENVEIQVRVPAEEKDFLLKELTEGTAGRASFQILEEGYYRDFT